MTFWMLSNFVSESPLSSAVIIVVVPRTMAVPMLVQAVLMPTLEVCARSAKPPTPLFSWIRRLLNWLMVISPDCSAAYSSLWALSPA